MLNSNTATTGILWIEVRHCEDNAFATVVGVNTDRIYCIQASAKQPPDFGNPTAMPSDTVSKACCHAPGNPESELLLDETLLVCLIKLQSKHFEFCYACEF
ncbi:hypothetical protein ABBQ32_013626 [Trebouxia sp. C0010 RCD-2024]